MSRAPSGYHRPVLAEAVLAHLDPSGDGLYLDGTVGGAGHARLILERCTSCRLLAIDRDPDALAEARRALEDFEGRVRFLLGTFDAVAEDLEVRERGLAGALLDLGVSSWQLDRRERGFSFARGVPLDMRMGGDTGRASAADLLNRLGEAELARVFREYGEEPRARRLARQVVRRRARDDFSTSDDLVDALSAALGRSPKQREKARIFQALRIAVNEELVILGRALPLLREVLADGGVLVVIAYHSLEDRIVKRTFRDWSRACVCPPGLPVCACRGRALGETLTRKPRRPDEREVAHNPRARSALLRAWRKAA